jgi:cysteine desulfurase / selenocysteine lyase
MAGSSPLRGDDRPVSEPFVYLDNAATTYPKPHEVLAEMVATYERMGVSPGRGSYDAAVEAGDFVDETRKKVARFFGAADPTRVIFGSNATDALNTVIQGLARPGDHFVATHLDHNSVLRPLHALRERGVIGYDLAPFDGRGFVDPDEVAKLLRPNTRAVVMTFSSNVLGTIQPIAEIARICAQRGVPLVVDAAQGPGQVPIDMTALGVSAIAFTGHKSLYGPSGIGGLVLAPGLDVETTRFGGTGMSSYSLVHSQTYPLRLEAGTLNLLGVIGLSLGIDHVTTLGLDAIHAREMTLLERLHDGLAGRPNVAVYCATDLRNHLPVLACNVSGVASEDVGAILDGDYRIAVRTGLHCAPMVHRSLGTAERGAVRFGLGLFNTEADVDLAIEAMGAIAGMTN